jgi:hypothetical protein
MPSSAKKVFEFTAQWDAEAHVWWCSNDILPVTTEAPTLDELLSHVKELAPEMAVINGLATAGDEIEVHITTVQSMPVPAAA